MLVLFAVVVFSVLVASYIEKFISANMPAVA